VVAAGAVGSTYLLLRNRAGLPGLSPAFGTRVSSNGDYLGWVRDCRTGPTANGDRPPRYLNPSVGPVITTAIKVDEQASSCGRGFLLQDAGAPSFADWMWQITEVRGDLWRARGPLLRRLIDRLRGRRDTDASELAALMLGDAHSSAAMMPVLGMGRDVPNGRYRLRGSRLELDWRTDPSSDYFDAIRGRFEQLAAALGGEFMRDPLDRRHRAVAAHPVGGCPMGDDSRHAVVDRWGRVYGQPGLWGRGRVGAAGAGRPEPELHDRGARRPLRGRDARAPGRLAGAMNGIRFHERMSGWLSFDQLSYNQAASHGERAGIACEQQLEIEIDDIDRFISDPGHLARVEGSVTCEELGGELTVQPGSTFELFVGPPGSRPQADALPAVPARHLRPGTDAERFQGPARRPNLDIWSDTSRLFVRVLCGHVERDPDGPQDTVATGILYISHAGLLRMLTTFRGGGRGRSRSSVRSVLEFDRFFLSELKRIYGGEAESTSSEDWPAPTSLDPRWQGHPPGERHELPGKPGIWREIIGYDAGDPEHTQLTLHHLVGEHEPHLGPLLMIPGAGVRPNLFYDSPRRPTVAEAMLAEGYDVWIQGGGPRSTCRPARTRSIRRPSTTIPRRSARSCS